MANEKQRKEDVILDGERKAIQKERERQARREARERRRKEEELKKLKDDIKANFVDKGEVKENLQQIEAIDMTGHYEKNRNFAGTLGGQLMQLAITLEVIHKNEEKQSQKREG